MNGKRYASMLFVAVYFMSSCSFSFAVFAERTGFTGAQETYSAIVETSDVSLAVVEPVNPVVKEILEEGNVIASEHDEGSRDIHFGRSVGAA